MFEKGIVATNHQLLLQMSRRSTIFRETFYLKQNHASRTISQSSYPDEMDHRSFRGFATIIEHQRQSDSD